MVVPSLYATVIDIERAKLCMANGATDLRINTSHMPLDRLHEFIAEIKATFDPVPPVLLDLQGGKMRLAADQPKVDVATGSTVTIGTAAEGCTICPEPLAMRLLLERRPATIAIDDGKVQITDFDYSATPLTARVSVGGTVRMRKGMNMRPFVNPYEGVCERDMTIVQETMQYPFVNYALSFVCNLQQAREICAAAPGRKIIYKIELPPTDGVSHEFMADIMAVAPERTELWWCRGDHACQCECFAELGYLYAEFCRTGVKTLRERVPNCPIVLAGEVFDHLCDHPVATRSEICHLGQAFQAGFTGAILSNETAFGKYPAEAVKQMRDCMDYFVAHQN